MKSAEGFGVVLGFLFKLVFLVLQSVCEIGVFKFRFNGGKTEIKVDQ